MNITIRRMSEADAEAVAQLSGELGYPSDADAVRRRLRAIDPADFLVVAVSPAEVVIGFIHGRMTHTVEAEARVHIVGLVVSSNVRRSGVGRRLIAEVERWAATTDAEAIVVRSNTARAEAHEFYPAAGYEKVKTQAVYLKRLRD
jgi:ribosomal protein S18 acetylase RimI-like enzyme